MNLFWNHFGKPNEQSQARLSYAMARNGRIYSKAFYSFANLVPVCTIN